MRSVKHNEVKESLSGWVKAQRMVRHFNWQSIKLKRTIIICSLFTSIFFLTIRGILYIPEPNYLEAISLPIETYAQTEIREPLVYNGIDSSDLSAEVVFAYNPSYYQIYTSKNAEIQKPIASLTKLMTALLLDENREATSTITLYSDFSWMETSLGVYNNSTMTIEDVLETVLVGSKNDVAENIRYEFTDEQTFLNMMNARAIELGMEKTNYASLSGYFDDNNYSTARDLQKLIKYFFGNEELMKIVGYQSADVNVILPDGSIDTRTVLTTNQLLFTNPNVKGIKTGYTGGAGQCLIILADYGGNDKVVVIILNSQDRFGDAQKVLDRINKR